MTDRTAGPRLSWLDALRGYAALVVTWFHLCPYLLGRPPQAAVGRYIDLGKYGVLLFFLVSGYVIPMSLERHGSLRRFWIGRIFRIYPAYLVTTAATLIGIAAAGFHLYPSLRAEPVTAVLAHATMMVDPLGLTGVQAVYWTLSYEMIFYLLVAGLFVHRLHRTSAWWAAGLALVALVVGTGLPNDLLAPGLGSRRVLAAVLVVVLAGSLWAYVSGSRAVVLVAGGVGIALLLLPALNGAPEPPSVVIGSWQGLLMLATMFAGTVVYRMERGELDRWAGAAVLALVAACMVAAHVVHHPGAHLVWYVTTAAIVGTFAVAFALRHRRFPAVLTWIGAVSYPLYLLHPFALMAFGRVLPLVGARPPVVQLLTGGAFATVTLALSWLCHRYVELPGRRLGRRVAERVDRPAAPRPPRPATPVENPPVAAAPRG